MTKRHGYLPTWRCQTSRVMPPHMMATAVHFTVDVSTWVAALIVVPAMGAPFSGAAQWTPESVFLVVALTVQLVASQSQVLKVVEPDFFGLGRWFLATLVATAVVLTLFDGRPVSWDLLAAGSLLVLVLRAAAEDAIFSVRRSLYHRASLSRSAKAAAANAPATVQPRPVGIRLATFLPLRLLAAVGRPGWHLVGAIRH